MYPWGNIFNGKNVNFCDVNCSFDWADKTYNDDYAEVSPVGYYPSGQSVYGALDMAGNVWEWVNDWYDVYPGGTTTSSKFGQKYHVLRGGSWFVSMHDVRSADRYFVDLTDSFNYFSGFRCSHTP
jgi:formylglycine-generating enzyme required for sulfatase activity